MMLVAVHSPTLLSNQKFKMRSLLITLSSLAFLAACSSTTEHKAEMKPAVKAEVKAEDPKLMPMCYSGDAGKSSMLAKRPPSQVLRSTASLRPMGRTASGWA